MKVFEVRVYFSSYSKRVVLPHALQKRGMPTTKWIAYSETQMCYFNLDHVHTGVPSVLKSHTHTILWPTSTTGALSSISILHTHYGNSLVSHFIPALIVTLFNA